MPQASRELRAEWGITDKNAIRFLESRGYKLTADWRWKMPAHHKPDEEEIRAVCFLIDEWDYGGMVP